jgi:hypothetical protein
MAARQKFGTAMTSTTHSAVYVRTKAGKNEIGAHSIKLSRPARNLLVVIDASCIGEQWIGKVNGSTEADLNVLLATQLIAPKAAADAGSQYENISVEAAVNGGKFDALYTLLTHEAKERFGLINGFRLILKIEGCSDLVAMQAVALDFFERIRKAHGEESAARFCKQLGTTDRI